MEIDAGPTYVVIVRDSERISALLAGSIPMSSGLEEFEERPVPGIHVRPRFARNHERENNR